MGKETSASDHQVPATNEAEQNPDKSDQNQDPSFREVFAEWESAAEAYFGSPLPPNPEGLTLAQLEERREQSKQQLDESFQRLPPHLRDQLDDPLPEESPVPRDLEGLSQAEQEELVEQNMQKLKEGYKQLTTQYQQLAENDKELEKLYRQVGYRPEESDGQHTAET